MKRLVACPLPFAVVSLTLFLSACGGGGGGVDGTGGTPVLNPFCETDAECAAGSTNECAVATCDTGPGVCINTPVPDGTPCDSNEGVCRDSFCAQTELKAFVKSPNPEPNALFGTSVSVLGDRMVVGAPSSGPPFGKVAVFERTDGAWAVSQQINTPTPGGATDGLFAWTVASGDTFFAVGAMGFGLGGRGSVRIYRQFSGDWRQDPFGYLQPEEGNDSDLFGASLALTSFPSSAAVDDVAVVGAPGYSTVSTPFSARDYSGAAYVFEALNSAWTEAALLRADNAGGSYECMMCQSLACPTSGEGDGFGVAVAISGDTIVVGAPVEGGAATGVNGPDNDDAPGAGAAYVFKRNPVTEEWEQTAYLKASNTGAGDHFGFAVAIDGDIIAVGAEREDSGDGANQGDNSAVDAGAVYIFERAADTWAQTQYLKASNVATGYFFGANLAMSDTTLVVGSPGESSIGGEDSGAAYVFTRAQGAWAQSNFYKAFNADAGSSFAGPHGSVAFAPPSALISCDVQATTTGASLSLSGDTVVVGTPYEDSAAVGVNGVPTSNTIPDSGAVYIFDNGEEE